MTVNIILKGEKNKPTGYLKVLITDKGRKTTKSLKIKVNVKNWNRKKQRVTSREHNHEAINTKLKEVLQELGKQSDPVLAIKSSKKTILMFYQGLIDNTINIGTRDKSISIRNKFIDYLKSVNLVDIHFNELNTSHVQAFFTYMSNNGCSNNTSIDNLKKFKSVIKKAIKARLIVYTTSPFTLTTSKAKKVGVKCLSESQVKQLMNCEYKEFRKKANRLFTIQLDEVVNVFLFQIFAQGLRVADVQLLRWSEFNIVDNQVFFEYTQLKTKKPMSVKLTILCLKSLHHRLPDLDKNFNSHIESLEFDRERLSEYIKEATSNINEVEKRKPVLKVQNKIKKVLGEEITADDLRQDIIDVSQEIAIETFTEGIIKIDTEIYNLYVTEIANIITSDKKHDFVFHFLKASDFRSYTKEKNLTKTQGLRLKASRDSYNRWLAIAGRQAGINTPFTSHVARHTYTQLLVTGGADIGALSKSLGHSHLSTTQTYINQLPNNKVQNLNDQLTDTFN